MVLAVELGIAPSEYRAMGPALWHHLAGKLQARAQERRQGDAEYMHELAKALIQAQVTGASAIVKQLGEVVKGLNMLMQRPVL